MRFARRNHQRWINDQRTLICLPCRLHKHGKSHPPPLATRISRDASLQQSRRNRIEASSVGLAHRISAQDGNHFVNIVNLKLNQRVLSRSIGLSLREWCPACPLSSSSSSNCEGRWGITDDFATSFLHFPLFSTSLWDLPNSRPVHSQMLSSHLFFCRPCLLPPFTVPCKMVLARPDELET